MFLPLAAVGVGEKQPNERKSMSWNIKVVGKPADVKAAVLAVDYIPQPLKDTVALFADAITDQTQAIEVKSRGHFDQNYGGGCVSEFSINQLILAPPAPPAPDAGHAPQAPPTPPAMPPDANAAAPAAN